MFMTTMNRGGHHAIFPNATVEKLEGTVLVGPWCDLCGGKRFPHIPVCGELASSRLLSQQKGEPNCHLGDPTLALIVPAPLAPSYKLVEVTK